MEPVVHPRGFRWRPTREGLLWLVAAAVMLSAGLIKLINLLILISYFMLALVVLNAWLARRSAYHITLQRRRTEPVFAGQPATRFVSVTNTADRGTSITVLETSAVHRMEVFVPVLTPGESRQVTSEFQPTTRGRFLSSPLLVVAGYPFGLVNYTVPAEPADSLVVLPTLGVIDLSMLRRWLIRTGAGDNRTRRPVRSHSIQAADVRGVRVYRPGDSPRDVHWRTTARRNEIMVREYDSTEPLDLLMVVELSGTVTPSVSKSQIQEATLSLAASIFWAWCHSEEMPEATLVVAGQTQYRSGRASEGFGRNALMLLADAQPMPDTDSLPREALRRRSNRCARILVTNRPHSPLAGHLRSQTGLPFVTVDPATPLAWYTPPRSPAT